MNQKYKSLISRKSRESGRQKDIASKTEASKVSDYGYVLACSQQSNMSDMSKSFQNQLTGKQTFRKTKLSSYL